MNLERSLEKTLIATARTERRHTRKVRMLKFKKTTTKHPDLSTNSTPKSWRLHYLSSLIPGAPTSMTWSIKNSLTSLIERCNTLDSMTALLTMCSRETADAQLEFTTC